MLIKVNAFMVEYVAAYLSCVYGSCRVWYRTSNALFDIKGTQGEKKELFFFFCLRRVNHKSLKFILASCRLGFQGQCPMSK